MKIFNIEDRECKLYIQKEDIEKLCETTNVPVSIYEKYKYSFIDSKNNKDFIEYTNPNDIEYLNNIDWIIDYREYTFKSIEELTSLAKHYKYKLDSFNITYNQSSKKEQRKNYNLKLEYKHLEHEYNSLIYLINILNNKESITLPQKKDYLGITYEDNTNNYILYPTLNKLTYIIERKDKKPIKENEIVDKEFIEKCIKYIVFYCLDNIDFHSIGPIYDNKEKNIKINIETQEKVKEEINNESTKPKETNLTIKKLLKKLKRD